MSYIEFQNIHKYFGENHVLKDVNLSVDKGQFVTLLGPSGCGKSTLLRCLSGLESVSHGNILLDGEEITHKAPKDRQIGMVFQQYSLFPNMNVTENIAFGLKLKKLPAEEIAERVEQAVRMVELTGKEKSMPANLSGGQQQRVALARSIVTHPKVLLLDEPLSAIDAKLRKSLRSYIKEIHRELGLTCLFVTHDQDEALIMSDVIHLFNGGQVEQSGNPIDMYTRPASRFAAGFIGNYNLLTPGEFQRLTGETAWADCIALRPEVIEVSLQPPAASEDLCILPATVKSYIPHGNVLRYTLESKGALLHADALFRSFKVFDENQPVYLAVEKRNFIRLES